MYIYIMRHGEAANIEGEDSQRPLTKKGVIEAEQMGFWLAQCKLTRLLKIFVSPYVRAQQSCNNVMSAFNKSAKLSGINSETLDLITPSGNVKHVHDFIDGLCHELEFSQHNTCDEKEAILFVSHMPFVSYLVGELTDSTNMPIFSTGAIAVIDYDIVKMQGKLVDIVLPENTGIL
jgi:phosphohistidine phosphatase